MAANGWLPYVVPMAYGTSTSSIGNDLSSAISQASGARVVPGLAILTNTSRPSITAQLNTAANRGLHDFIFFEATVISGSSARQSELSGYLNSNGPFQSGDFNRDLEIDAEDWNAFYAVYQGEPIAANDPPPFLDVNGDGVIDAEDESRFLAQFKAFRFGADGYVGFKERDAFEASRGSTPGSAERDHLFDLDGDGDVDQADFNRLAMIADVDLDIDCGLADLAPPFGVLDLGDINTFILGFIAQQPAGDLAAPMGVFDLADINAFVTSFSAGCP